MFTVLFAQWELVNRLAVPTIMATGERFLFHGGRGGIRFKTDIGGA